MKRSKLKTLVSAICIIGVAPLLISWGMFGHERINHAAVLSLPSPLQMFFYNHIDYITQESTVPDLRKYTLNDKAESPRHFIDLENYGVADSLPKTLDVVKKKYDEKFLSENGILPWYLEDLMAKLTKAFKEKRKTEILFIAADMGHYIGDAHMPLHTSINHDGQLTNQKGIHSFWEAHLPEMFGNGYAFKPAEGAYIENIHARIWTMINDSHSLVDTLLAADKKLKETYPADKIYAIDSTGKIARSKFNQQIHSADYSKKYHALLNGMIEKQLSKAITAAASFWYTAWVNAGKPDMSTLDPKSVTDQNAKFLQQELKLWKQGKLSGIESEKEF